MPCVHLLKPSSVLCISRKSIKQYSIFHGFQQYFCKKKLSETAAISEILRGKQTAPTTKTCPYCLMDDVKIGATKCPHWRIRASAGRRRGKEGRIISRLYIRGSTVLSCAGSCFSFYCPKDYSIRRQANIIKAHFPERKYALKICILMSYLKQNYQPRPLR